MHVKAHYESMHDDVVGQENAYMSIAEHTYFRTHATRAIVAGGRLQ